MIKFKLRYCKVQMARYLSGDLSAAARRRVARYIDESEDCYQEYMRQRAFALKLERGLPTLGQPDAPKLEALWSSIEKELQAPPARRAWLEDLRSPPRLQFSYGLTMVLISLLLLLPLAIGYQASPLAIELPRRPLFVRETPSIAAAAGRDLTVATRALATPLPRF